MTDAEIFSWRVAQRDWGDLLRCVAADTQGPLHFLVLKAWMAVFGDSLAALRGLSVLCSALAALVAALAVHEALRGADDGASGFKAASSRPANWPALAGALVAAVLVATSPPQLAAASTARCYALGVLLAAFSAWLLLRALRAQRRPLLWWAAYGTVAALFCYTHYYAFFAVLAQAIYVGGQIARRKRRGHRTKEAVPARRSLGAPTAAAVAREPSAADAAVGFTLAGGVALALFSPWLPVFLAQAGRVHQGFPIPQPTLAEARRVLVGWLSGAGFLPQGLAWAWMGIGALLVAHTLWRGGRAGWFFLLQSAVPWGAAIGLSLTAGRSIFLDRYLVFAHLALCCLWGVNVARLPGWPARTLVAAAVVSVAMLGGWTVVEGWGRPPSALHRAVRDLSRRYQPGDLVIVDGVATLNLVRYEARQSGIEQIDVRCHVGLFGGPGWRGLDSSLTADDVLPFDGSLPAGVRRVWRVLVHGQGRRGAADGMQQVWIATFQGGNDSLCALALDEPLD